MAKLKGIKFTDQRETQRMTEAANVNVRALITDMNRASEHERLMFAALLNDLQMELAAALQQTEMVEGFISTTLEDTDVSREE